MSANQPLNTLIVLSVTVLGGLHTSKFLWQLTSRRLFPTNSVGLEEQLAWLSVRLRPPRSARGLTAARRKCKR